jgi:hypothetical protein
LQGRGHRHGHRARSLLGSFGRIEIEAPRTRLNGPDGKTREWNSQLLRAYQRRTLAADALIAGTYLSGAHTRRVRRAMKALFGGALGKDTVSRVARRQAREGEEPVAGLLEAVGHRFAFEPPLRRKTLQRLSICAGGGVYHVGVVGGDLLVQTRGRVCQQVPMHVHGAA